MLKSVPFPRLQPLPLTRRPEPFSHPDWLFEVKYDGFRALAYRDPSGGRLVSMNGNRFSSFTDLCAGIELFLKAGHAVLDGEIACLDDQGYSQFNQLLFRRGSPRFCAFDLLYLDGKDLRDRPLIERKGKASACFSWPASATSRVSSPSTGTVGTWSRTETPRG